MVRAPAPRHAPAVRRTAVLTLGAALAACAPPDFPEEPLFSNPDELDAPELIPLGVDIAEAQIEGETGAAQEELAARGADLRDRADALRTAQP